MPAAHQITHDLPHRPDIAVYAVPGDHQATSGQDHTLLLSYIDVVVQGYLREFGPEGAARFFATTDGWNAPVIDDRDAPRYSRHCRLVPEETALVDTYLEELQVRIQRI